ncbi:transporter substrate-binding domain-containing protein, partial [Escherichia coli]|nr:transporter substrate-binding domain-containing protein [Escherichia coli]
DPFGAGVRVAVEQGSSLEEELAHEYPNIALLSTPTAADALDAVLDKTVDVYAGVTYPTRELIARPRYRELSIVQLANQQVDALHFAAPRDRATLIRHLDRHLAQLPDTTMSQLRARWIAQGGTSTVALQLSDDE